MTDKLSIDSELLECAVRHHLGTSSPEDEARLRSVAWEPLHGGRNNGVYRADLSGHRRCVKIYKVDERQRGQREWLSLRYLREQGIDCVPLPYHFQICGGTPVLIMEFVSGTHLGCQSLSRGQLHRLATRVKGLHSLSFSEDMEGLRVLRAGDRVDGQIGSGEGRSTRHDQTAECARLWERWWQGRDPGLLRDAPGLVFSRVDTSLANCLWDSQDIRFVDFEYAGWTERVFDLAEQVEHVQSRGTPDAAWDWFIEQFDLSPEEQVRVVPARRLLAFYWAWKLWPKEDQVPSELFVSQVERLSRLCQE